MQYLPPRFKVRVKLSAMLVCAKRVAGRFAGLTARELGNQEAGIQAILMEAKDTS